MIENNNFEVCPICYKLPNKICNCIIPTKTCKNKHSWFECNRCFHITKYIQNVHINECEKCINYTYLEPLLQS